MNFISEFNFTGIAYGRLLLRLRAKQLCRDEQFKASLGWYQKWKKRPSISLCTKTTLAQRLPQDLEEKTTQFQRLVISAHMDKTAQFESLPSRTVYP